MSLLWLKEVLRESQAKESGKIVYTSVTGVLYYNANKAADGFGNDGGQFAQFRAGLELTAADFNIF